MVKAPIHVRRPSYRGSNPKKQAKMLELSKAATLLERHINDLLQEQQAPIVNYMYHEIARDTGIPEDIVSDLCFGIDGGNHGFTVIRSDLTDEEVMELMHSG
jgi:hypothetical protein